MEGKEELRERAPRLGRQRSLQYYWGPRGLLLFKDEVSVKEHRKNDNRRSKDDSCVARSEGRFTATKSGGAEAAINALMREEGEPVMSMREEGGVLSSGSSTSRLLMPLSSASAATCHEVTDRRRSDADPDYNDNNTSSRLSVTAIIDGLLELLQKTTQQRRQVARLIRSIDPSIDIAVEGWQHHDHEYAHHHRHHSEADDDEYAHHHRHHHYEADHQEEEEEEASSKTCSITSDSSNSSRYALFLMQRVSQLRRQVALLTHELLATKARNRLLQDQLHYFLSHTSSSSSCTIDPHPHLVADEIKDMKSTPPVVEKSRKCSSLSGEDEGDEVP